MGVVVEVLKVSRDVDLDTGEGACSMVFRLQDGLCCYAIIAEDVADTLMGNVAADRQVMADMVREVGHTVPAPPPPPPPKPVSLHVSMDSAGNPVGPGVVDVSGQSKEVEEEDDGLPSI